MKFGAAAVGDALIGTITAHSVKLADRLVPKGAVLDAALVAALHVAGHREIIVARLEPGDVAEADAARRLGACFSGGGVRVAAPVHGRVNLFAQADGLLRLNVEAIVALNRIDESVTLATLADATSVVVGDMVATLKIIPFAVAGAVMARALALLDKGALVAIAPFRALRVGLVLSRLPHLKDAAIRNTIEATRRRVVARRGTLIETIETAHDRAAIAGAIFRLIEGQAELILIAGASAVTDRGDVAPAAIVACGGRIERFGMPVDPGNLICFGQIGGLPAIVLPGCARSPKLNGIDFVLDRVFAGEPIDDATIADMGVGGLLKDFAPRPAPRFVREAPVGVAKIGAVVLAAGRSSRAAPANKLLVALREGGKLVVATVDHVLASRADPVIVVVGHQADAVMGALAGRRVIFVRADRFEAGMAESLKAGIAALPDTVAAVLICLGDMPLVDAATIDRLIAAYDPDEGRAIVVPTHRGRRGNPVLWDRQFFGAFMALEGDAGARHILAQNIDHVAEVAMDDDRVLRDFDTADALVTIS